MFTNGDTSHLTNIHFDIELDPKLHYKIIVNEL